MQLLVYSVVCIMPAFDTIHFVRRYRARRLFSTDQLHPHRKKNLFRIATTFYVCGAVRWYFSIFLRCGEVRFCLRQNRTVNSLGISSTRPHLPTTYGRDTASGCFRPAGSAFLHLPTGVKMCGYPALRAVIDRLSPRYLSYVVLLLISVTSVVVVFLCYTPEYNIAVVQIMAYP